MASERSGLMVPSVGLSGFFCGVAVDEGKSTGRSTVDSGAATMKMISSTRMTSMNGVTLISCVSAKSASSSSSVFAIEKAIALLRRARMGADMGAIEIARQESQGRARRSADQFQVALGDTRKVIVDDHGRDCRGEAERGGKQRLGDTRSDNGKICGLRF